MLTINGKEYDLPYEAKLNNRLSGGLSGNLEIKSVSNELLSEIIQTRQPMTIQLHETQLELEVILYSTHAVLAERVGASPFIMNWIVEFSVFEQRVINR